jgi:glutamyl-Q tRNA(Asp) synthetase
MTRAVALTGRLTFRDRGRGQIACQPLHCGDVVVDRKDGKASYHLAATVDDALQGVTLVTRGEDLLPSTDIHRVLQTVLDLPEPEYWHHGLLLGPDGKRFAKRDKSVSVPDLRTAGHSPAEILAMAEALAPAART